MKIVHTLVSTEMKIEKNVGLFYINSYNNIRIHHKMYLRFRSYYYRCNNGTHEHSSENTSNKNGSEILMCLCCSEFVVSCPRMQRGWNSNYAHSSMGTSQFFELWIVYCSDCLQSCTHEYHWRFIFWHVDRRRVE